MVGKRIAKLRKERGWTQADLAKATRISKGYISAIEEGRREPPAKTLIRIVFALGTTIDELER